jgi:PAS domain S-box-containing protein
MSADLDRIRVLTETLETEEVDLCRFFRNSPDLAAIVNDDGTFRHLSLSWPKILGWTEEELNEKPWLALIHPDDKHFVKEAIDRLAYADPQIVHCRIMDRDHRYVVFEFSLSRCQAGCSNILGRPVPDACLSCPESGSRFVRRAYGCHPKTRE